jgi:hypothetical protein
VLNYCIDASVTVMTITRSAAKVGKVRSVLIDPMLQVNECAGDLEAHGDGEQGLCYLLVNIVGVAGRFVH